VLPREPGESERDEWALGGGARRRRRKKLAAIGLLFSFDLSIDVLSNQIKDFALKYFPRCALEVEMARERCRGNGLERVQI
jgi:hypothetical protein